MSDLELAVRRVVRGDPTAFGEIVAATTPRLFRLAARMMSDTQDAEDVLQESFLRAYDALTGERFDGRAGVETWLYRIVTNTALDALRARKRRGRHQVATDVEAHELVDSGATLEARAALRELAQWMDDLPAEQRAALVLKEFEGLSSSEVARMMNCSEGAIEQRLVRARATLRARTGRE